MKIRIQAAAAAGVTALLAQVATAGIVSQFELIGAPVVPRESTNLFEPPDPALLVSLNPQPLPPFPPQGTGLNLSDPTDPVYTYPPIQESTFAIDDFSFDVEQTLNIGSQSSGSGAGKVTFNPFQITRKSDSASVQFLSNLQIPGGTASYLLTLIINGIDPDSFAVSTTPPILPCVAACAVAAFTFTTPLAGEDPTVSLNVTSGNTVYAFSEVPEPASWCSFLLALALIAGKRFVRVARGARFKAALGAPPV